jgi:hypothetical protein
MALHSVEVGNCCSWRVSMMCLLVVHPVKISAWSLLLVVSCPPLFLGKADLSPRFGTHASYTGLAAGTLAVEAIEGCNGLIDAVSLLF